TAWIPLKEVDMTRAAVGVNDGSHRFFDHPRASPRPHSVPPLTEHHLSLWPYMKPVPLRAGEAIIFDNRTIHASFPNRSGQTRMAVIVGLRHEEAALRHYYQVPNAPGDQLAVYETNPEFYFSYTDAKLGTLFQRGECPDGVPLLETITRECNIPDAHGLEELICSVPSNRWQPAVVDLLADRFPQLRPEPEHTTTEPAAPAPEQPTRSFLETYSIPNILAEIRWRLFQRKRTG
ncbi:MAG: phytanoyl-CoA dioxygenase family protein, partial [Bacteroidota bacterium]